MEPALRLVPFTAAHLGALAALAEDPDTLRFTRFPDPPQPGFPAEWLARYEEGRRAGTREAFAILDADADAHAGAELLGLALAVDIDRAGAEAELGYVVAPAARGRGVATAALRALTRWAFEDQDLARATLIIDAQNAGSQKVAERCGYALERVDRDAEVKPGRRSDLLVYARSSAASGAPQASRSSGGGIL
ncbi:MAG: GCN5-related N-acetyltransferase [Conexibacter sp.]|nr:GCN5-related N-acetyltransferase [Conexibacter sp.]